MFTDLVPYTPAIPVWLQAIILFAALIGITVGIAMASLRRGGLALIGVLLIGASGITLAGGVVYLETSESTVQAKVLSEHYGVPVYRTDDADVSAIKPFIEDGTTVLIGTTPCIISTRSNAIAVMCTANPQA